MPISDNSNYQKGHFTRVYNHIIKPACLKAKFNPIRADDVLNTNHIALDVIKKIIESDMAICDLSSQNPNVLYELGIRQAFDKPVTLIKDFKTKRIFDIQGIRDVEYDENLRIDTVEDTISTLAQSLLNTYEQKEDEVNSLVKLLAIAPAEKMEQTKISIETELILSSLQTLEKKIKVIERYTSENLINSRKEINNLTESPESLSVFEEPFLIGEKFTNEELEKLNKGDKVNHSRFGIGIILKIEGNSKDLNKFKAIIDFNEYGEKKLLLQFSRLTKVL